MFVITCAAPVLVTKPATLFSSGVRRPFSWDNPAVAAIFNAPFSGTNTRAASAPKRVIASEAMAGKSSPKPSRSASRLLASVKRTKSAVNPSPTRVICAAACYVVIGVSVIWGALVGLRRGSVRIVDFPPPEISKIFLIRLFPPTRRREADCKLLDFTNVIPHSVIMRMTSTSTPRPIS